MKISPYVEKLSSSEKFKEFSLNYPDNFVAAGFFIIDFESKKNTHQIDYFVPSLKKIAAFSLDDEVSLQMMDLLDKEKQPEKLDISVNVDLDSLQGILEDEMKNRGITQDIKKIIAVLQTVNGKKIWNLSCVLSGMDILRAHIEDISKSVLKMEKVSMFEMMKQHPNSKKNIPGLNNTNNPEKTTEEKPTKEELETELKKLENIEEEIKKEEKELKEAIEKS